MIKPKESNEPLTDTIVVLNSNQQQILRGKRKEITHFGVVRDYSIVLEKGEKIHIGADIVKAIVAHENTEQLEVPKRIAQTQLAYDKARMMNLPDKWMAITAIRKIFPEYEDESDVVVERVWVQLLRLLKEQPRE
jgi:hypothetical protein